MTGTIDNHDWYTRDTGETLIVIEDAVLAFFVPDIIYGRVECSYSYGKEPQNTETLI